MDIELIKTLLQSQQSAYKGTTEIFVNQFNTRISSMETKITELQRSLEFSQHKIDEMASENRKLVNEKKEEHKRLVELTESNGALRAQVLELEKRLNYQEDYSRRNNLRINGIAEREGGETWEQTAETVKTLLQNKLQLPELHIERAHRIGQRQENYHRTIVARFNNYADREAVMRSVNKLKGTRIYINEDLCTASQEIVKSQLPLLREAREQGKIAFFRHTKLIVKERNQTRTADDTSRVVNEASDPLASISDGSQHGHQAAGTGTRDSSVLVHHEVAPGADRETEASEKELGDNGGETQRVTRPYSPRMDAAEAATGNNADQVVVSSTPRTRFSKKDKKK